MTRSSHSSKSKRSAKHTVKKKAAKKVHLKVSHGKKLTAGSFR